MSRESRPIHPFKCLYFHPFKCLKSPSVQMPVSPLPSSPIRTHGGYDVEVLPQAGHLAGKVGPLRDFHGGRQQQAAEPATEGWGVCVWCACVGGGVGQGRLRHGGEAYMVGEGGTGRPAAKHSGGKWTTIKPRVFNHQTLSPQSSNPESSTIKPRVLNHQTPSPQPSNSESSTIKPRVQSNL